jgi:hypothetical protein
VEFIFEIIFQFLGEMLLQLTFECLAELGMHSLGDTFRKPRNPLLSTIGFILWGAISGGISLLILPHSAIANPNYRVANLILTPTIAGLIMMLIGRKRSKKGATIVALDRFGYAFLFAFSMAVVRFIWAK